MFATFVKKELLNNILTLRFALVSLLLVFLAVSATSVRTLVYNRLAQGYSEAVSARIDTNDKLTHVWNKFYLGHTVEKAPNPLSIFAGGLESELTRAVRFVGDNPWEVVDITWLQQGKRALEVPSLRLFLALDMATIIALICSLLALLLTFDTISGERENGTLKVLLAGPLPRDIVISAKLTAGFITALLPLIMAWVVSILCALFFLNDHLSAEILLRLFGIILLSFLYMGVFFALGLSVSAWSRYSSTALGICLTVWIILALAVPNLIPMAVRRFINIPSSAKINMEISTLSSKAMIDWIPSWQKELNAQGIADWNNQFPILRKKSEQRLLTETAQMNQYQQVRIANQVTMEAMVARLSPTASFTYAATNLAGTGAQDYLNAMTYLEQYRSQYLDARHILWLEWTKQHTPRFMFAKFDQWPQYAPQQTSGAQLFNRAWPDIVLLLGLMSVLFLIAYIGFIRLDVTA